jgi:predicted outer membrane lipoprotein
MSKTTARYYALGMALTNLCAAVLLAAMFGLNALYNYPSVFVTIVAPLGAASFAIIACMWTVHAYARGPRREQRTALPLTHLRVAH